MLKIFTLLLLLPFSTMASEACQMAGFSNTVLVSCPKVFLRSDSSQPYNQTITLNLYDGFEVTATLSTETGLAQVSYDVELGNRKTAKLRDIEVQDIREASKWVNQQDSKHFSRMLRLIENLPANEDLMGLTIRGGEVPWPMFGRADTGSAESVDRFSYNMICESVGKMRLGFYQLGEDWITEEVMVGEPATDCYGRCGRGCGDFSDHTYTQECLDHDICHRQTGENLGVCKEFFLLAMTGYVTAPSCDL